MFVCVFQDCHDVPDAEVDSYITGISDKLGELSLDNIMSSDIAAYLREIWILRMELDQLIPNEREDDPIDDRRMVHGRLNR